MNLSLRKLTAILTPLFIAAALFAAPKAKHVFVISIDQANPDALQRTETPVMDAMVEEGAHSWNAFTIVPSITLPSHTSMLTGVGIQAHQIDWNNYQPDKGFVEVPTVFSLAKEKGFTTAMYVSKEKFKHLDVPGTVDKFVWPRPKDNALEVAKAFAEDVAELKPNMCFIHFRDPDSM